MFTFPKLLNQRERKWDVDSSDHLADHDNTDDEGNATRQPANSDYNNLLKSPTILERRILCNILWKACLDWFKPGRTYGATNWDAHGDSCPEITGVEVQRVRLATRKEVVVPAGSSMASFFTPVPVSSDTPKGAWVL
ncbi:hypothetical protein Hypma_004564 [Hypsizygus marmoreus]|uniref:Uncharacterized protein n=1 Tax=Hypsizygus marmoreus TaxID=39966 RepID=A0A369K8C9_HYPMA|nr:hypothetical protein Hypma_004564 [Hypsizygus marmoreus]